MISNEAQAVQQALIKQGLETPLLSERLSATEQIEQIAPLMQQIMQTLGLDLQDDSLANTPSRIAKMFVNEIFLGLDYANFPAITSVDNKLSSHDPVCVHQIQMTSTCEHHFVTMDGHVNVAYIPQRKILGLSKINRIVQFFAKRPQIQERFTQQIRVALQTLTDSEHVAVQVSATHFCVKARGVNDTQSYTVTHALAGDFQTNPQLRAEFLRTNR